MSNEPKIIAFCCNWCAYAAADLAGTSRIQYPTGLRIIRVMCSGMVHPEMILEALNKGADGVMVFGCHLGECHYRSGNQVALSRAEIISEILEDYGYETERFSLNWVSSAEPDTFAEAVGKMNRKLCKLVSEPSGQSTGSGEKVNR